MLVSTELIYVLEDCHRKAEPRAFARCLERNLKVLVLYYCLFFIVATVGIRLATVILIGFRGRIILSISVLMTLLPGVSKFGEWDLDSKYAQGVQAVEDKLYLLTYHMQCLITRWIHFLILERSPRIRGYLFRPLSYWVMLKRRFWSATFISYPPPNCAGRLIKASGLFEAPVRLQGTGYFHFL